MHRRPPQQRRYARVVQGPRAILSPEIKCCDSQIVSNAIPQYSGVAGSEPSAAAFAGITWVNNPRQGATVDQRIGNKIVVKSITARFGIFCPTGLTGGILRWGLVYDAQPNGAFPAIGELFLSNPGGGQATSGINIANKSRFSVIRDQWMVLDVSSELVHMVNCYAKGRWETEFGSATGTIGAIKTGAIYLFLWYIQSTGATPVTNPKPETRIRYYD